MNLKEKLCVFVLLIGAIQGLLGHNYYVSTTGSDTNAGSLTAPFLSIQHGTNQLIAGDTLFIRGGMYQEKIYMNNAGNSSNSIVIMNYLDEEVILDGTGVVGLDMWVINSINYVVIRGLIIQNNFVQFAKGFHITQEAAYITIDQCIVRNIGWTNDPDADPYSVNPIGQANAILVNGRTETGTDSIVISNCSIYDIISGNSEALTFVGNNENFTVLNDTIFNTKNIAIVIAGHYGYAVNNGVDASLNQSRNGIVSGCMVYDNRRISNIDAPAGIYVDGGRNIVIEGNTSFNNGNGLSVGCENAGFSAENIKVINNVVYNNDNQGIFFGSNAGNISQCTLRNNTFFHNGSFGIFYAEVALQNSSDCLINQNIIIPRSSAHYAVSIFGYTTSNLVVDNNLAYRYNADPVNLYVEGSPSQFTPTNSMFVDPMFADTSSTVRDFYLVNSSSAINAGIPSYGNSSTYDYKNLARCVNGLTDLGAFENQTGGCPETFTIVDSMLLNGVFIAKDTIIINAENTPQIGDITIDAPSINIISDFTTSYPIRISENGCQD